MTPTDQRPPSGGTLAQLVRAEQLKLRRSFAGQLWWIAALLGALCSGGLAFTVPQAAKVTGTAPAIEFVSTTLRIWALLFVPLLAIIRCAAAGQVEFAQRGLKHLFALPVSRTRLFIAKAIASGMALAAASLLFYALTAAVGIQRGLLPLDGAHGADEAWRTGAARAAAILLAALTLGALHVAISVNMASYAAVVSLGIGLLVFSVVANGPLGGFAIYYPWSLPSTFAGAPLDTVQPLLVWAVAVIVLGLAAGAALFRRRQAL